MINDALEGKIDMIITKSISRFARNTLDTLKYVRLLKEKNVAIMFEKENINTLTMNGEMLLVILSSLAQQESESISANVTMGLKMKMKRGELVGYNGCLGYDYDSETKTISINDEEAEIVRYIFRRYVEGSGCFVIAKELKITNSISPFMVNVLMFSFSNMMATFFSFNKRTYFKVSKVFLANLDIDFVIIISIFPSRASLIIRWKSTRLLICVPDIASSA